MTLTFPKKHLARIEAIFSDVDGTLLNSKSQLSERTIQVIKKLSLPFILVSGRYHKMLEPIYKQLDLDSVKISANGALILDKDNYILRHYLIDKEALIAALSFIEKELPDTVFLNCYDEKNWYCNRIENPFFHLEYDIVRCYPDVIDINILSFAEKNISKFLLFGEERDLDLFKKHLTPYLNRITLIHDRKNILEIFPGQTNKGKAVLDVCQQFGYNPKNVLGAGDTMMDASLLLSCGFRLALNNASEDIQNIGNIFADSNDEDGLAKILEDILEEKTIESQE